MNGSPAARARNSWSYRVSGLRVKSEVPLVGSIEARGSTEPADIHVRLGDVPAALKGAIAIGPNWQSAPPAFLLEVPGVVRFLVTSGSEIIVAPAAGIEISDAAIFVASTGIAIALYQRGALVLHASALVHQNRTFAFGGPSGAGKSTLAAMLCLNEGCEMLSDDVSAIELGGTGAVLRPDGRRFRLWEDAVELLHLAGRRGPPVRTALNKYHIDFPTYPGEDAPPLCGIYVLAQLPEGSDPSIERLAPGRAAFALDNIGYRRILSRHIGERADKVRQLAQLLERVPVFQFSRSPARADNACNLGALMDHWTSLE